MNILACDTSTSTLHLALATKRGMDEIMIEDFQHSEGLLDEILKMLKERGLEIKDLDLLVCTRGPGSFTSLRIAMSTFKGFSLACSIPLVSIPTLKAISKTYSIEDVATLAVIDAKKKRYYLGLYRNGEALIEDVDGNIEDILSSLEKEDVIAITGPDSLVFGERLKEAMPEKKIIIDTEVPRPLGHILVELGLEQFKEVGADDIGQGPVYIRRSDAEEALLAKQKGEKA